jgi:methionyl-tRNA formyltransferase
MEGGIKEQPQHLVDKETHAPKIFKETCRIDWNQPVRAIHNLIRGLAPVPTAFTTLGDKQLKIFSATTETAAHEVAPGTADSDGKTYLRFATPDGWLYCTEVQYEGKKKMPVADFLRGYRF